MPVRQRWICVLRKSFGKIPIPCARLFKDEQRKILDLILAPLMAEAEAAHIQLYEQNADLMRFLVDLRIPLPKSFPRLRRIRLEPSSAAENS